MREYRLRTDLERASLDGFALPLGFTPGAAGAVAPPQTGYTVDYIPGEDDEPDSYSIYVVVSHERLPPIVERMISLLPDEVFGIVEVGSRDAYRALDVFMSAEPLRRDHFRRAWSFYAPFLLEDSSIGSGANGEDPFVEVFVDQWKGLSVHVPLLMRDEVERILGEFGLAEVQETWPPMDEDAANEALHVRGVLAVDDEFSPGLDEMLLELRQSWKLELNIDARTNVDDSGRPLGQTLWHAMVIVDSTTDRAKSAYASIWATAGSLAEMENLVDDSLDEHPEWEFGEMYTIDRVAYDERPDELAHLAPKRTRSKVHLVTFEL